MTKWDYRVLEVRNKNPQDIEAILQHMGREGWELVSTPHYNGEPHSLYLKRPIPD